MAIYMMDYENVGYNGLKGINGLTEKDKVYIFYSKNANTLTFDVHEMIMQSSAQIFYYKVNVGKKNALDVQLATYLGYLIAKDPREIYYNVSKDDGFDYVRNFWKQKNIEVKKIVNLSMMEAETEQEEQIKKLMELLGDDSREEAQAVSEIIEKFKTKQAINNALVKRYDSTKGGKVYKAIKPLLKDKN